MNRNSSGFKHGLRILGSIVVAISVISILLVSGSVPILGHDSSIQNLSLLSLVISNLSATPSTGISSWNPVNLSAISSESGLWNLQIIAPNGADVTAAGATSFTNPNPSSVLAASWTPTSWYSLTGTHQAVVRLTDEASTVTATVAFAVYNFQVLIRSVTFTDASFNPIPNPRVGQTCFIRVEVQDVSSTTLPMVFIPTTVDATYVGAGALGGMLPGQIGSVYIRASFTTAGSTTLKAFAWAGSGGAPLAQPVILPITVIP